MRTRPQSIGAVYLIIAVSATFLFVAVEPVRSYETEMLGPISGTGYTSQVTVIDCVAVIPNIGRNTLENRWAFRLGSLRILIPLGMYSITAFSKSPFIEKIQTNPIDIKNSILLKLRI
ncbi:MAG: hypothetical protein LBK43_00335 [Treponema sp.]|nr:hypothetical protein [Treponema sp.]